MKYKPVSIGEVLASSNPDIGAIADAAVTDPALEASAIAVLKGLLSQLQGSGSGAAPVNNAAETLTATIANGAAVSDALTVNGKKYFVIHMPAAWTAAYLAFQTSPTLGGTYQDLHKGSDGTRVIVYAEAGKDTSLDFSAPNLAGVEFFKLESVTADFTTGAAVNQGAERTITITAKT